MSFSTQTIRYGWVALASLGVLTGTTIYVANNQRHQVKPQDIIEIALGTYERCLATQTSTNPTYYVTPPSFVRTWTSNVYTTNGVTFHTNIVTNTIGWHIDRDMMVSLDTTIKALVPYYVDTNTVYDGTTNITMLTVTGLWASLGIGDKTNQFTRTPAWTNPISTNWIVNYTSYWPSTNGVATNINYTSDYRQVVNYAQSWTATGGHVWVTSSNWDSQVVQTTNVATYGYYPWQIYVEDLQERYKVLEALRMTHKSDSLVDYVGNYRGIDNNIYGAPHQSWNASKGYVDSNWNGAVYAVGVRVLMQSVGGKYGAEDFYASAAVNHRRAGITGLNTNLIKTADLYVKGTALHWFYKTISNCVFNSFGYPISTNWTIWSSSNCAYGDNAFTNFIVGPTNFPQPGWCAEPTIVSYDPTECEGWEIIDSNYLINWQFNYCTNKYW